MRMTIGVFVLVAATAFASDSYVFRGGRSYVLTSTINRALISGGMTIENVVNIRNKYDKQFLWVQNAAGTWMIKDPDYLQRATAFFAEENALRPEQKAVAEAERKLDQEEERLEDRHDAASKARMKEVRRQQKEVSRREQELDDRQEALEKIAEDKLWVLVDDAIRNGVARRLR